MELIFDYILAEKQIPVILQCRVKMVRNGFSLKNRGNGTMGTNKEFLLFTAPDTNDLFEIERI